MMPAQRLPDGTMGWVFPKPKTRWGGAFTGKIVDGVVIIRRSRTNHQRFLVAPILADGSLGTLRWQVIKEGARDVPTSGTA